MPYLIYDEQGNIEVIDNDAKTHKLGYFVLDEIQVGPNYLAQLNTTLDKTHPTVLGPEWVVLIKLLVTFLLSEDGQYFMRNVIDWLYKLWLRQRVNKFVKRYKDDFIALTGENNLDRMKNTLYAHVLAILQYQLNSDSKIKLYQTFKGV